MDIPQPIAVVIPCYKVCDHILVLLKQIPDFIDRIYVVDDACPDQSGQFVLDHQADPRVEVIVHDHNQGVGGGGDDGLSSCDARSHDDCGQGGW